jgi:hypothetical protein
MEEANNLSIPQLRPEQVLFFSGDEASLFCLAWSMAPACALVRYSKKQGRIHAW